MKPDEQKEWWIDLSFFPCTERPYDHIRPCRIIGYDEYEKLKSAAKDVLFAKSTADRALAEVKLKELIGGIE